MHFPDKKWCILAGIIILIGLLLWGATLMAGEGPEQDLYLVPAEFNLFPVPGSQTPAPDTMIPTPGLNVVTPAMTGTIPAAP